MIIIRGSFSQISGAKKQIGCQPTMFGYLFGVLVSLKKGNYLRWNDDIASKDQPLGSYLMKYWGYKGQTYLSCLFRLTWLNRPDSLHWDSIGRGYAPIRGCTSFVPIDKG